MYFSCPLCLQKLQILLLGDVTSKCMTKRNLPFKMLGDLYTKLGLLINNKWVRQCVLTFSQSWLSQCGAQSLSPQGWMASGFFSAEHWVSGTTRPSGVLQYTWRTILPCPHDPEHWQKRMKSQALLVQSIPVTQKIQTSYLEKWKGLQVWVSNRKHLDRFLISKTPLNYQCCHKYT